MYKKFHSCFLGLTHLARYIFIGFSLYSLFCNNRTLFYIFTGIYVFFYSLQILLSIKRASSLILSLFGLVWFQIPFSISAKKNKSQIAIMASLELIECIFSGHTMTYFVIQEKKIPLKYSIPLLCFSIFPSPILYEGTLFHPVMSIHLKMYLLLIFESFLFYSFISVVITLNRFWIVFGAALWRVFAFFDPFALWASVKTAYSPFRAIYESRHSRSMIIIFLLHAELFYLIYSTWWNMVYTNINIIFLSLITLYYPIFFIYELIKFNTPFEHRIRSISMASNQKPWDDNSYLNL